jgi:Transposase IS116/IS110/IS902 family
MCIIPARRPTKGSRATPGPGVHPTLCASMSRVWGWWFAPVGAVEHGAIRGALRPKTAARITTSSGLALPTAQPLRCTGSSSRSIWRSVACVKALRRRLKRRWPITRSAAAHDHTRSGADCCLDDFGQGRRSASLRPLSSVAEVLGMNLSTQQSGRFRGVSRHSKYGNARLRRVLDGGAERGAHA